MEGDSVSVDDKVMVEESDSEMVLLRERVEEIVSVFVKEIESE